SRALSVPKSRSIAASSALRPTKLVGGLGKRGGGEDSMPKSALELRRLVGPLRLSGGWRGASPEHARCSFAFQALSPADFWQQACARARAPGKTRRGRKWTSRSKFNRAEASPAVRSLTR